MGNSTTLEFFEIGEEVGGVGVTDGCGEREVGGGEDFSGNRLLIVGIFVVRIKLDSVRRAEGLDESEAVGGDCVIDSLGFREVGEVG